MRGGRRWKNEKLPRCVRKEEVEGERMCEREEVGDNLEVGKFGSWEYVVVVGLG